MARIQIYTDGGCSGNPGPGAWAFVICAGGGSKKGSGSEKSTTNNRMELLAVINALETIKKSFDPDKDVFELYTDSKYVKQGITEWIKKWETNGFMTAARKPVKNQDLWILLRKSTFGLTLSWHWVAGHSGNVNNEECDSLVQIEIAKLKG
jgi:ribonuclease HI